MDMQELQRVTGVENCKKGRHVPFQECGGSLSIGKVDTADQAGHLG